MRGKEREMKRDRERENKRNDEGKKKPLMLSAAFFLIS